MAEVLGQGLLIALGGNALAPAGRPCSLEGQRQALRQALGGVAQIAREGRPLVLTHGNGPQVGHALERVRAARETAYALPLHVCVAQTQAEIGYLIAEELEACLRRSGSRREVACLLTRAEVAAQDPRLGQASKPVGSREGAAGAFDGRPRVPSPQPLRVLETQALRALVADGAVVVAGGGGGVPVVVQADGTSRGIDAVIDKDATSTVLALALGLPRILQLTAVDAVRLGHRSACPVELRRMTPREARQRLAEGQFEAGSMGPKVEAAVAFLEAGGQCVDVGSSARVLDLLAGRVGTRIVRDA